MYRRRYSAKRSKVKDEDFPDFSDEINQNLDDLDVDFGEKPRKKKTESEPDNDFSTDAETYIDKGGIRRKRFRLPWDLPGGIKPTTYEEHLDDYDYVKPEETVVEIYTREMWDADPPAVVVPMGEHRPIQRVNCFYTGSPGCFTKQDCMRAVKELQRFYMEKRGLEDIPYSFLIGPDGNVYEGRGFEVRPTKVHKLYKYRETPVDSLDIAYIGPYYQEKSTIIDEHYDPRKFWPKKTFVIPMHQAFLNLVTNAEQNEYLDDDSSFHTEVYV